MSTSSFPWEVVQKYPKWRKMNPDHPCFNNLTEVYNYRRDGNYCGLLSTANIKEIGTGIKLDLSLSSGIKKDTKGECISKPEEHDFLKHQTIILEETEKTRIQNPKTSELKVLISPIVRKETVPGDFNQKDSSSLPKAKEDKHSEEQERAVIDPKTPRKQRFDGDELLNLEEEEYCDLLEDYIPLLDLSIMAGKGGVGKTMLYLELSLCIVTGKEIFLERHLSARHRSVLIIATEDNERRMQSRIKRQIKKVDPEVKSLKNLIIVTTGLDLVNTIRTELSAKQFDLVVIDALGDVLEGDQNSSVEIRKFFSEFQNLISEFGTTFLFVTHEGKSAGRDRRTNILGSVSIVDRVRSAFTLYNDDKFGLKALSIVKSNNISEEKIGKPMYLALDNETLTFTIVKDPIPKYDNLKIKKSNVTSGAVSRAKIKKDKPGRKTDNAKFWKCKELLHLGKKQCEIAEELGISKGTISRWVKMIKNPPPYDTSLVGDVA